MTSTNELETVVHSANRSSIQSVEKLEKIEEVKGRCSNGRAVINVILTAVGIGILFLAEVFSTCGWLGGFIILGAGALMTMYSTELLYYAISKSGSKIASFTDLGDALFGRKGRLVSTVCLNVTLMGICAVLLNIIGTSLCALTNNVMPWRLWVVVSALIVWPLTWLRSMNEVGIVSSFGLVTLIAFVLVVVVKGLIDFADKDLSVERRGQRALFSPGKVKADKMQLTTMMAILSYIKMFSRAYLSYFMASCVPTLINDMRKPEKFPTVSRAGNLIVCIMYVLICASSYLAWGDTIKGSILPVIDNSIGVLNSKLKSPWAIAANALIVATGFPHFIALLLPISVSIDSLSRNFEIPYAYIGGRSLVLISVLAIAVITQEIVKVVDLLASVTVVALAIFLPVAFYMKAKLINKDDISNAELAGLGLKVAFGVLIMVVGLIDAVKQFVPK